MIPKEETPKGDIKPASQQRNQDKENKQSRQGKNAPPSKVVIRHLPATMTKETFIEEVSPLPKHDYLCFVNADATLGQFAFSRAYISFCNQEDIFIFTEKFDGYVFVDGKGDEHSAIVEFAPFQKIPKKMNRKRDNKCGTIENDPDYLKFLESREKSVDSETPPSSAVDTLEEINAKERELKANKGVLKMSTPLLDYLRKKKEDKIRIREERKDERDRKRAEKRKVKDEERKKFKDTKRQYEKTKQEKVPQKILSGKPKEETKNLEVLTKNLKDKLKIGSTNKAQESATSESTKSEQPAPAPETKKPLGKEMKPDHIKKRDNKREKKYQATSEEKKTPQQDGEKSEPKGKANSHSKETKSYKEERQKMKEARAARAAKQENTQAKNAEIEQKGESEDSAGSSKAQGEDANSKQARVRNKDRPAMQIYRPGMLKRTDGKPNSDGAGGSDTSGAKEGVEEGQRQTKSRTFVSRRRKPKPPEQAQAEATT